MTDRAQSKWFFYGALAFAVLVLVVAGTRYLRKHALTGGAPIAAPRGDPRNQPPWGAIPSGGVVEVALPPVPRLQPGCEGECCGKLNSNRVLKATALYEKPEAESAVLSQLPEGSEFKEVRNFVRVLKHGKAIVREDVASEGATTADLAIGDELELLSYDGEGLYTVWAKGKLRSILLDPPAYEIQSEAETESWVEITLPDGRKGWALAPELDWGFC